MRVPEDDAWLPSARDLAHLIATFDNCSHVNLGQWSFWQNQDPEHLSVCARTGRAFLTDTRLNKTTWVSPETAALFGWTACETLIGQEDSDHA